MSDQLFKNRDSISLKEVVTQEYRTYQIYTLMDRAIPYLRDGLKPCQRRILYTLYKNQKKGLMKVSSATGLVLTLHPHGPQSIETSIVNLAQDYTFANNYPLIDKKGYFGERMETSPAASRYIECQLGEVAKLLLFDDLEQVVMEPNYDEKELEPRHLLPKLPLMLLNGAEGIGTGFSSTIPAYSHKEIIDSMIQVIQKGKAKKITPWFRNYSGELIIDEQGRILTRMRFEEIDGKIFITELPRGFDSARIYKHLAKFIDNDFIKDYIDSSVDNQIHIELIFKRGQTPSLKEVEAAMGLSTSMTPNFTLISDGGVKVLTNAEEIIEIFTRQRLEVVKRRYELLIENSTKRLLRAEEIIRFIEEKHYAKAPTYSNRKDYCEYLKKSKFTNADYLADLPIYRMTIEEANKQRGEIVECKAHLKDYGRILASDALIKEKLYEELITIRDKLTAIFKERELERKKLYQKLSKMEKKPRGK